MRAWLVAALATTALLLTTTTAAAAPHTRATDTWQPNGTVNVIKGSADGNRAYIGGSFSYVGPITGPAARVDDQGRPAVWPTFEGGVVYKVVWEPASQSWFVGGSFTTVNGMARPYLVRVKSNGAVDLTWTLHPDRTVTALAVNSSRLYVGFGADAMFNADPVKRLAAIDIATRDVVDGWVTTPPVTAGLVADLELQQSPSVKLVVGGMNLQLNGVVASGAWSLGRVNPTSGTPDNAWPTSQPGTAGAQVFDVALDSGITYVGGNFSSWAKAYDDGGTQTGWDPQANGQVNALAVVGSRVFIGGGFTSLGGAARNYLGSVTGAGNAAADAWNPNPNGSVRDLDVVGGWVYAAGTFAMVGSSQRHGVVRLPAPTSPGDTAVVNGMWAPATDGGVVHVIVTAGTSVVFGGQFESTGGVYRKGLASIDISSGVASDWDPMSPGTYSTVAINAIHEYTAGNILYIGGRIDGRARVLGYNAATGAANGVDVDLGAVGAVEAITVGGTTPLLAIGGDFPGYFTLRSTTGGAWSMDTIPAGINNGMVRALDALGPNIYLGGDFTYGAARYNPSNAPSLRWDTTTWLPNPAASVVDIAINPTGPVIYLAGSDTAGVYAVNGSTGAPTGFDTDPDNVNPNEETPAASVKAIALAGSSLFAGGSGFALVNTRLVELVAATGDATVWNPIVPARLGSTVSELDSQGTRVFAANASGIAIYEGDTTLPHANVSKITDVAGDSDGVFVSGTTAFVRPSAGSTRTFTVSVRAYDKATAADPTYSATSGLRTVSWPGISNPGVWSSETNIDAGRPRGLVTHCWNDDNLDQPDEDGGVAVTRAINYSSPGNRPDMASSTPVLIAQQQGPVTDDVAGEGKVLLSCRWKGYVTPLVGGQPTVTFQAVVDNGFRMSKVNDLATTMLTGDTETVTGSPQSFSEPMPLLADWFESSGGASADLQWNATGSFVSVPEGAFVTDVMYDQDYSAYFPTTLSSGAAIPHNVTAADRAGHEALAPFSVRLDASAPISPANFEVTSPAFQTWSNVNQVTINLTESSDVGGSGLGERRIERRTALILPGTYDCDSANPSPWSTVQTFPESDPTLVHNGLPFPVITACYQFRYVAKDRVGNESSPTSPNGFTGSWFRIDRSAPTGGSFTYVDGPTNLLGVSFTATLPTDVGSGILSPGVQIMRSSTSYAGGVCNPGSWTVMAPVGGTGIADDSPLGNGCYRYQLAVNDLAGNPAPILTSPNVAKVDHEFPNASFDQTGVQGWTDGTFVLTGGVSDLVSGPSSVTVSYSGPGPSSGTPCNQKPVDDGAGNWTCTISVDGTWPEGTYTFQAAGHDVAGNMTLAPPGLTVVVDRTDPTVTLSHAAVASPLNQYWDTSAAIPTLWYAPSAPATNFDLTTTVADNSPTTTTFPALGTGWTDSVVSPTVHRYTRVGGIINAPFTVTVDDPSGNSTDKVFNVTPDTSVPAVGAPTYPSGYLASGANITISGSPPTDTGSGVRVGSTAIVREDGTLANDVCTFNSTTPLATGTTTVDTVSTVNGTCHRYRLVAEDNVNNSDGNYGAGEIKIDTVAPTLTMTTTPPTSASGPVTVAGTVTDSTSDGRDALVSIFDGTNTTAICAPAPLNASDAFTCTWTPPADGAYTMLVTGYDLRGNASLLQSFPILVDTVLPTVTPQLAPAVGSASVVSIDNAASPPSIWVNGNVGGGFVIDTQATAGPSGVYDVTMPSLGANWSAPSAPAGAPAWDYLYTWTATPATPTPSPSQVTVASNSGRSNSGSFRVQVDANVPSGGSIDMPNGIGSTASVAFNVGVDASSGIGTWILQRRQSPTDATTGACLAIWGSWGGVGGVDPNPPFTDNTVQRSRCYQYQLVVTDEVGHSTTYTDPSPTDAFTTDTVGVVITPGATTATEGGSNADFTVHLRAQPTAQVTVTLTGNSQYSLSTTTLVFDPTPGSWDTPQTVTVTAANDDVDETPNTTTENIGWSTSAPLDTPYDGLAGTHQVQVTDNDVAGVSITPVGGITVTEGAGTVTYGVRLDSQPPVATTVTVTPSTIPSQLTSPTGTLTFTDTNWNIVQDVTVSAVDDPDIEGTTSVAIGHTLGGAGYTGVTIPNAAVSIVDNDAGGLEFTGGGGTVAEGSSSSTDVIQVRLAARPTQPVTVNAAALGGQVSPSPSSLSFNAGNWNQYQSFTVTAVPDTMAEPLSHVGYVSITTSSADTNFHLLPERVFTETVSDDDQPGLTSVPGDGWVYDAQGRLLLEETGEKRATIHLTVIGDPMSDVIMTPSVNPADQVVVSPASVRIPAGSHAFSFDVTVYAVDDQTAEPDGHQVSLQAIWSSTDPVWGLVSTPPTIALITDGAEPVLREEDPEPDTDGNDDGGGTDDTTSNDTGDGGQQDQTTVNPAPTEPTQPVNEQPTEPAPPGDDQGEEVIQPGPSLDGEKEEDDKGERPKREEDEGNVVTRPIRKVANWAKDNPVAASVGASVAGSTALWAAGAKPMALAGKALGGGLHLPGPDGLDSARDLLKRGKRESLRERLFRFWRRKRQFEDELDLDDDWDDLFNDRAA